MVRECRRYLSFPLEEAVIDYPSIIDMSTGKNKRFKATIIAVHRSRIEQYMHLLKRAGLSLETIDFDLCCLLRLHNYLYAPKDDPFILCNVDYSQTLIAVVTQDRILAHHHVPWGIQPLLNRLESNLELSGDSEQTAGLLTTYGLYYEDCINLSENSIAKGNQKQDDATEIYRVVFQILSPYVDKLVHEFYKIIGYARSEMQQVKFEEISMYGQANSVNFLDQYLEKRLNIRTRCVNPMVKLALRNSSLPPDTSEGAAFAMALGLAMQKLRWL
jgi:type IV pilus assembly protein PilM